MGAHVEAELAPRDQLIEERLRRRRHAPPAGPGAGAAPRQQAEPAFVLHHRGEHLVRRDMAEVQVRRQSAAGVARGVARGAEISGEPVARRTRRAGPGRPPRRRAARSAPRPARLAARRAGRRDRATRRHPAIVVRRPRGGRAAGLAPAGRTGRCRARWRGVRRACAAPGGASPAPSARRGPRRASAAGHCRPPPPAAPAAARRPAPPSAAGRTRGSRRSRPRPPRRPAPRAGRDRRRAAGST